MRLFKNFLNEFKKFAMRGNVIDMAVGIIIGAAFGKIVDSLVKDVIMPPIGLLIGGVDFSQLFIVLGGGQPGEHYATIEAAQAAGATTMNIGVFMNSVVSFLITMFAVFLLVRFVAKMRSKQPVTTRACPYCKTSISKAACKCPNCCSDVTPEEVAAVEESDLKKSIKGLKKIADGQLSKVSKIVKKTNK